MRPPQWPEDVRWSPGIANQGRYPLDANHDGLLDLLLLGRGQDIAYLALGQRQGHFKVPTLIHSDRLGAVRGSTAVADLNADGLSDLVYLSTLSSNDAPRRARMTALLSRGDGSFEPRVSDFDGYAGPVAIHDLNQDGHADVVVALPANNQEPGLHTQLAVLHGAGDGTFVLSDAPMQSLAGLATSQLLRARVDATPDAQWILAGHDEDGRSSAAICASIDQPLDRCQRLLITSEPSVSVVRTADLDGDDIAELLFYDATLRTILTVRPAAASANASTATWLAHHVAGESYALADGFTVADLDRDGAPDLILPGSDTRSTEGYRFGPVLIVAFGDGTGRFDGHRVLQLAASDGEFGAQALSADLNADGEPDLLLGTYGSASQFGRTAVLFGPLPK